MKVTILMPTLNEEVSIEKTIDCIPKDKLTGRGYDTDILVVDGGSTDKTVELAKAQGVNVIIAQKGYGRQYRAGFEIAGGEIIATADSDCSYPMEQIPELINTLITENLDFISTDRFAFMDRDSMAPLNKIGNRFLTLMTNILFNFNLKDSQSGMWIFRKAILEQIKLTGNGMSLSQEIKIKAFAKFRAREINSSYRKRVGKVKLRIFLDGLDNLFSLFKIRFGR
jgi:glycosyltransferase involved in cell wall biosynthesis